MNFKIDKVNYRKMKSWILPFEIRLPWFNCIIPSSWKKKTESHTANIFYCQHNILHSLHFHFLFVAHSLNNCSLFSNKNNCFNCFPSPVDFIPLQYSLFLYENMQIILTNLVIYYNFLMPMTVQHRILKCVNTLSYFLMKTKRTWNRLW